MDVSNGITLSIDAKLSYPAFQLHVKENIALDGVTGLFGPSGSGKSTLLRIIAGFEKNAIGSVRFADEVWQNSRTKQFAPPHRRPIGYVFQDTRLFEHRTVEENLQYATERSAPGKNAIKDREVVATFDLRPLLQRGVGALSGGERQRVAIARTLLTQPRLLLLDEPLAALDGGRKGEILPYLEALAERFGIPTIYVSHAIDEMAQLARHVLVLKQGKFVSSGSPADVFNSLDTLSHTEAVTILQTRVIEHLQELALTILEHDVQTIVVPLLSQKKKDDMVSLYVSASDVALATQRPEKTSFRNVLTGILSSIDHDHDSAFATASIDINGTLLRARLTRHAVIELRLVPGMTVFALLKTASFGRRY